MNKFVLFCFGIFICLLIFYISEDSDKLTIDIYTNGTDYELSFDNSFFDKVPNNLVNEIQKYLKINLQKSSSTKDTITVDLKNIARKYGYEDIDVDITTSLENNELPYSIVVDGTSMYPTLKDGQRLVAVKTKNFKIGDVVVSKHDKYGLIIKRVSKIDANRVYLISDNKETEIIYKGNQIITKTPLKAWVPKNYIIAVVPNY